jgi:hypothetical protein
MSFSHGSSCTVDHIMLTVTRRAISVAPLLGTCTISFLNRLSGQSFGFVFTPEFFRTSERWPGLKSPLTNMGIQSTYPDLVSSRQ